MKRIIQLICIILFIELMLANRLALSIDKSASIWAIGDCHKINPTTGKDYNPFADKNINEKNYLWDSKTNTVTLFGAKNEYIAFQIIIEARHSDLKDITVIFSDLIGPDIISNKNIELFKAHYTPVWKKSDWPQPSTGTGEYPDALIPFEIPKYGAPFTVKKGRNQAVWVDVYIPKNIGAGEYKGDFSILSRAMVVKKFNLNLNIWDFTLPDENHLIAWSNYYQIRYGYGLEKKDPRYIEIEKSIWKLCHDHRLNALLRHAHIAPEMKYDRKYGLYFDYQNYSERLGGYINGSIFDNKMPPDIFLLPISGGTEYRWPRKGPFDDPDYAFIYACKDLAAYFRGRGWDLSKCYIYLSDEPKVKDIDKIIRDANLIHKADKDLKTMVALHKAFNADTLKKLENSVDMWLVDGAHYDSRLLKARQRLGEKVGFYQQGEPWNGNENLDSDGLSLRTWPWIAWKYGADCIYLYSMTEWYGGSGQYSIWERAHNKSWSNSQGVLIYPGKYIGIDEVVGSIRLKQWRRGMQDYEYMYLAKQRGKNPDEVVNKIIVRALDEAKQPEGTSGEWSHNPEDWYLARVNLAKLILGEAPIPTKAIIIPKTNSVTKKISAKPSIKSKLKQFLLYLTKKLE